MEFYQYLGPFGAACYELCIFHFEAIVVTFPRAKGENISFRETKILFISLNETLNAALRL